jgi:hypothetical protein
MLPPAAVEFETAIGPIRQMMADELGNRRRVRDDDKGAEE